MPKEASLITFDPDGDIILELSQSGSKTNLQVSSKVLTLASPVFATMFRSKFRENLNNNKAAAANPLRIPLPDEDEGAFTTVCSVIHYHRDRVPQTPSLASLEKIAVVCDKWDFTSAITPSAKLWLQDIDYTKTEDLYGYLLVAYVLDVPHAFSIISWEILIKQTGPFLDLPGLMDNDLIRHNLLAEFVLRKFPIDIALISAIDGVLWKFRNYSTLQGSISSLVNHKIWPTTDQLQKQSISAILNNLAFTDSRSATCTLGISGCACRVAPFLEALHTAKGLFLNVKRGLCLDCVKTSGKSRQEKKCRFCITP